MTEEHEFITISPPIPWERVREHPALNAHLQPFSAREWSIRLCGPQDRAPEDGDPYADEATEGPVDQLRIGHRIYPEPLNWDWLIVNHTQAVLDAFPEHEFTGDIDVHDNFSPLTAYRRLTIRDHKAVLVRPTVTWE